MGLLLEYSILSRLFLLSVSVRGFLNGPELRAHPVLLRIQVNWRLFVFLEGLDVHLKGSIIRVGHCECEEWLL
jgi:hypothetical protein